MDNWFPTTSDSIATGCLLAACMRQGAFERWRHLVRYWPVFAVLAFVLNVKASGRLSATVFESVINVCIAICIAYFSTTTLGPAAKLLNSRPMVFVGVLSYSLYLWQQPFLNRGSTSLICSFPLNLLFAFSLALICHYAIERPFLALRSSGRTRALADSAACTHSS